MIYTIIGFVIAAIIGLIVVFGTNIRPLPGTPAYWLWATFKPHEQGFDIKEDKKKGAVNQVVVLVIAFIVFAVIAALFFYVDINGETMKIMRLYVVGFLTITLMAGCSKPRETVQPLRSSTSQPVSVPNSPVEQSPAPSNAELKQEIDAMKQKQDIADQNRDEEDRQRVDEMDRQQRKESRRQQAISSHEYKIGKLQEQRRDLVQDLRNNRLPTNVPYIQHDIDAVDRSIESENKSIRMIQSPDWNF